MGSPARALSEKAKDLWRRASGGEAWQGEDLTKGMDNLTKILKSWRKKVQLRKLGARDEEVRKLTPGQSSSAKSCWQACDCNM